MDSSRYTTSDEKFYVRLYNEPFRMNISLPALLGTLAIPAVAHATAKVGNALETSFAGLLGHQESVAGAQPAPSGEDLTAEPRLSESLEAFHRRLAELLQTAGLDSTVAIHIRWHPDRRLTVRSAHPQWQQLEAIVANDAQLTRWFRQVAYLHSLQTALPSAVRSSYDPHAVENFQVIDNLELVWSDSGVTVAQ